MKRGLGETPICLAPSTYLIFLLGSFNEVVKHTKSFLLTYCTNFGWILVDIVAPASEYQYHSTVPDALYSFSHSELAVSTAISLEEKISFHLGYFLLLIRCCLEQCGRL